MSTAKPSEISAEALAHLPQHVAIIMDGNNRYGQREGLARGQGHVAGKRNLDPIVEHAHDLGIKVLTVFAFSSENWQRPPEEVDLLMQLFHSAIAEQLPRMHKNRIAMRFIGNRARLSPALRQQMHDAESETLAYAGEMSLVIAISYGGMWDMTEAARQLAQEVAAGRLQPEQINETLMQQHIQMGDLPPVDLLIRTGGDYRMSNFLLWQAAYAEYYFTETLWPDFTPQEFDHALGVFAGRERRFGRTSEQVKGVF